MVDVSRLIEDQLSQIQREAAQAAEKHLSEFLFFQKLTLEDFTKDYVFEWRPTEIEEAISHAGGMPLDMRPDTTTVKFVTFFRIRRKTDDEKLLDERRLAWQRAVLEGIRKYPFPKHTQDSQPL